MCVNNCICYPDFLVKLNLSLRIMRNITLLLGLLLVLFSSCGSDYGNRIISEESNLTVLYTDSISSDVAVKFAQFWKENELTGNTQQTIQLSKTNVFNVKLITSFPEDFEKDEIGKSKGISFEELELLNNLRKELDSVVFENKSVQIQLCNDHFVPLMTIE